jgi:hypothetical protein
MIRPLAIAILAAQAVAQPLAQPAAERPNAAEGYRYAWALLRPHDWATIEQHYGRDEPIPDEVLHLLESGPTPKAIRYILMSANMDYCRWPDDPDVEPMEEPHLLNARKTFRLLAVDADRCRLRGQADDAARRIGAIARLAVQVEATTADRAPDAFVWMVAVSILHGARTSLDADLASFKLSRNRLEWLQRSFKLARDSLVVSERDLLAQVGEDIKHQRAKMLADAITRDPGADHEELKASNKEAEKVIEAYLAALDAPDVEGALAALRAEHDDDSMMRLTVEHLDAARDAWKKATATLNDDLDHADAVIKQALEETGQ